jgi:hypothetical protein
VDFNRNALNVEVLAPHVHVGAVAAAHAARVPESQAVVHADSDADDHGSDRDGSDGSGIASGSGDESSEDDAALNGFQNVDWRLVFNSALPRSDTNMCDIPPLPERRRRRSDDDFQSASSDNMDGAPAFAKDNQEPRATRIPRECKSASQFVHLLFPHTLIDQIVVWTNAAATQHPRLCNQARYARWRPTTSAEITLFFAICVYLGVVKVQNRKLIWREGGIFQVKWVSCRMSLRRFEGLLNALNCCGYWTLTDADISAKNSEDAFWQIKELVSECNARCAFHFKMGRSFSVDEAVIPFKGRHRARCYNPKKPAKYHLKKFSLNCSKTGFVYCHYHYGGKDEQRPAGVPASVWPIKKLVDQCQALHHKDHFCATDNWYTCAQSLCYLRRRGIHCAGTIKQGRLCLQTGTRPGFPQDGIFKAARGRPKRARGDCVIHSTQIDGHDAYVTSWQDKKPVMILSSYHPAGGVCDRKIKVGRNWTRQRFFRPNVVQHYNATMGGTDLHDQRLAFARSTVKCRRWQVCSAAGTLYVLLTRVQPRVLIDLFTSMLLNAFVLYKLHDSTNNQKLRPSYNSFDFIADWLNEVSPAVAGRIMPEPSSDDDDPTALAPIAYKEHRRNWWSSENGRAIRLDSRYHVLQDARHVYLKNEVKQTGNGEKVQVRLELRRNCMYCGDRNCYTFCDICNVPLCLGNCCRNFHTVDELPPLK